MEITDYSEKIKNHIFTYCSTSSSNNVIHESPKHMMKKHSASNNRKVTPIASHKQLNTVKANKKLCQSPDLDEDMNIRKKLVGRRLNLFGGAEIKWQRSFKRKAIAHSDSDFLNSPSESSVKEAVVNEEFMSSTDVKCSKLSESLNITAKQPNLLIAAKPSPENIPKSSITHTSLKSLSNSCVNSVTSKYFENAIDSSKSQKIETCSQSIIYPTHGKSTNFNAVEASTSPKMMSLFESKRTSESVISQTFINSSISPKVAISSELQPFSDVHEKTTTSNYSVSVEDATNAYWDSANVTGKTFRGEVLSKISDSKPNFIKLSNDPNSDNTFRGGFSSENTDIDDIPSPIINTSSKKCKMSFSHNKTTDALKDSCSPVLKSQTINKSPIIKSLPRAISRKFSTHSSSRRQLFSEGQTSLDISVSDSPVNRVHGDGFIPISDGSVSDGNLKNEKLMNLINGTNQKINSSIISHHYVGFGKNAKFQNNATTVLSTVRDTTINDNTSLDLHSSESSTKIVVECSEDSGSFLINDSSKTKHGSNTPLISVGSVSPDIHNVAVLDESFGSVQSLPSECREASKDVELYSIASGDSQSNQEADFASCIIEDSQLLTNRVSSTFFSRKEDIKNGEKLATCAKLEDASSHKFSKEIINKSAPSPESCRDWVLKLLKTPKKDFTQTNYSKPQETPESTGKKINKNGFASKLQRALAVLDSRNNIRNHRRVMDSLNDRIDRQFMATKLEKKPANICPNKSCLKGKFRANSDNLIELNDVKEIMIAIAGRDFPNDPLPHNASLAFLLEHFPTETMERDEDIDVLNCGSSDTTSDDCVQSSHFDARDYLSAAGTLDFSSGIIPCKHLLVIFFMQQTEHPLQSGEMFKIKPPWHQLLLPKHPGRALFSSNFQMMNARQ